MRRKTSRQHYWLQAEEERVVDNRMHDRYCELRAAGGHPCEGDKPFVIEGAYMMNPF